MLLFTPFTATWSKSIPKHLAEYCLLNSYIKHYIGILPQMIDQVVFSSIHIFPTQQNTNPIFPYLRLRRIVSGKIHLAAAVCSCQAGLFCVTVSSIEFSATQKSPKATFLSPWGISYFIVYSSLSSEESSSSNVSSSSSTARSASSAVSSSSESSATSSTS